MAKDNRFSEEEDERNYLSRFHTQVLRLFQARRDVLRREL